MSAAECLKVQALLDAATKLVIDYNHSINLSNPDSRNVRYLKDETNIDNLIDALKNFTGARS